MCQKRMSRAEPAEDLCVPKALSGNDLGFYRMKFADRK
jgi:hypothetical protein